MVAIALHFGQNDSLDERVEGRRSPHPALLQSMFEMIAEGPARLRIISSPERGGQRRRKYRPIEGRLLVRQDIFAAITLRIGPSRVSERSGLAVFYS